LDVQTPAICVDPPGNGEWVEEKLKAPFPTLSDSKRDVTELYGTPSPRYLNHEASTINTPTLLLIDRTGTIRWIHWATNFLVRGAVEKDLAEARKLI
jgi:peroxiredoxin